MQKIYIYGASGHGLVVADIARACGYEEIHFIDDGENEHPSFDEIDYRSNIPVALGIGSNHTREALFQKLKTQNITIATLIHPSAVISPSATIGEGTVVMPYAVVNAQTTIGKGVILNTASVIEHENIIGDFAHISPNAALAGNVTIGKCTHIGIGSSIIQGIKIGRHSVIGAGSTVISDISEYKLCYGTPCRTIKDIE